MRSFSFSLLCLLVTFCLCGSARAEELRVSAAASLADVLKEIDPEFERETGIRVRLNLGASSLLARQIEEGAPADVFFSADIATMEKLDRGGLIRPETKKAYLSNVLVVVASADSTLQIRSMKVLTDAAFKRVATGNPRTAPVGIYAKEHLQSLEVWEQVKERLVFMSNARAALAAVESGNVEAGIVYKTDAAVSSKVKILHEVPAAEGPKITYPAAVTRAAQNPEAAVKYLKYLDAPGARAAFKKAGFQVLREPAKRVTVSEKRP